MENIVIWIKIILIFYDSWSWWWCGWAKERLQSTKKILISLNTQYFLVPYQNRCYFMYYCSTKFDFSLLLDLHSYCIGFICWSLASFLYCSLFSYHFYNYCDNCRSFSILKAIKKVSKHRYRLKSNIFKRQKSNIGKICN